ncbi:DUF1800 domain-containing protein [[Empedobacter] haloabium]|uniref:DUF1800 domain-containing protein n=1 Tax=[Empedobacter] haloabium TaxID=592317 RepID=A0ABZ1UQK5_9BURK
MRQLYSISFAVLLGLSGCGGNGSTDEAANTTTAASAKRSGLRLAASASAPVEGEADLNVNTEAAKSAASFLSQASFGPTIYEINRVMTLGPNGWLNEEFQKAGPKHRLHMDEAAKRLPAGMVLNENHFFQTFWKNATIGHDHLRERVTYALSQIFVVSFVDGAVAEYPRGVACYYDTLSANAFGNFRQLLEAVARHPMMGIYLSHMQNEPESETSTPDENFAREIMQLMSIGLHELNADGSVKLKNGVPIPAYTRDDVAAMAKVLTGWSWGGGARNEHGFHGLVAYSAADRDCRPMDNYPQFHSTAEKKLLGNTIAAGGSGEADLKKALDILFNHPNVGPFIGRQLIQRLVMSNPSPAYVQRVAAAFADNGDGVRGDMKAVLRAVLLDSEARNYQEVGKLREPVLRLANWMRAFNARSSSGNYLMWSLDDPLEGLGQSPMRSPSVFNFYRPNYIPPHTELASSGLVAPEMQITAEPSVVGYLNYMQLAIPRGVGDGYDIKPNYAAEVSLAATPELLVDRVNLLLLNGQMSAALRQQILTAINAVRIPAGNPASAKIVEAKYNRAYLAIFLTMASSEYLVQK